MAANDSKPIHVRVLFFGAARDAAGREQLELSLSSQANVASAFAQLLADYPALARFGNSLLLAVSLHVGSLVFHRLCIWSQGDQVVHGTILFAILFV